MPISLKDLLKVATEAAYLGGKRTLKYFNNGVKVETKKDNTPVTRADRESEILIRKRILRTFPNHSIIGEEHGKIEGSKSYRWIIDPIDGTKTFIHGVPLYGVLIGVEVEGKPSVGVVYLPALDEMLTAARGMGCKCNGKTAKVSSISRLSEATLLLSDVGHAMKRSNVYEKLSARTKLQRTWGDCYAYYLVATGRAEIALDPIMNPWDCAPFPTILKEAGGYFRNWKGEDTIWGKDAFATNGKLFKAVKNILHSEKKRK